MFVTCLPSLDSYSFEFTSPAMFDASESLEVRCIRIDGTNNDVQTWPDIGKIMLNNTEVVTFAPLAINIGQKKRKDKPATINKSSVKLINIMKICADLPGFSKEQHRIGSKPHFLGVYKVKRLLPAELFQSVRDNYASNELSDRLLSDGEVQIEGESITLVCVLSSTRIEVPARGKFCRHYRCFDLMTFIQLNHSSNYRKW